MRDCLAIAKALGDPQRVRALMALKDGELCLCQLIELLGLSPSTVSKHMAVLHHARLVETRKEGRWVHYRLPGGKAHPCVSGAVRWLKGCLRKDPQICADAKCLAKIRRLPKEEMDVYCRKHGRRPDFAAGTPGRRSSWRSS